MYEVEVKIRTAHDEVHDRLEDADAEPLGSVVQADTYYDAPHRNFVETDEALRVRQETPEAGEPRTYLTYKGPLVDDASKTRREAETAVADGSAVDGVLTGLGFEAAATVRKDRERYALEGYTVTLDDVDGLGEFVEVETETESDGDGDLETAREGAFDVLESLGLDPEAGIRTSYLGLLLGEDAQG
jgi:adenylate cyclase class 2